MNKIARAFSNGKAFIPFITCGDPDLETTLETVLAMEAAGADLIELGIPFSDPTAEGPVIEAASLRALQAATTTDGVFDMVEQLRRQSSIPLVIMTYANVVFSYGMDRFFSRCQQLGIDGLILPDVPFEERDEFARPAREHGVILISMIAPTSHERIAMIAKEAEGFLYIVSSTGTTGMRSQFDSDLAGMVEAIRAVSDVPSAIGFGISTPQQAAQMAKIADGVIVGSAIVRLAGQHGRQCPQPVGGFVASMKNAITQ